MKNVKNMNYGEQVKWRIRMLYLLLAVMLVYMVVVAELGGGDSRIMTELANRFSRLVFFGGMVYVISRIIHNKKLLRNRILLKQQMLEETDERNRYLHDKSGGLVLDILLVCLLLITLTASLFDMTAFYVSFVILVITVVLKTGAYLYYSRL
ncbi:MAG: hypothetical protein HFH93_13900 [Lachnospiraceae bacterium]|nr:hypothetical protein [Lachnospiraceae bacterium]